MDFHLVIVHVGEHYFRDTYIFDCIEQYRIFNSIDKSIIHLLVQTDNYNRLELEWGKRFREELNVKLVNIDLIPKSDLHIDFNNKSILDKGSMNGFWHFAAERFFALHDYAKEYKLERIFHIEYDNLIYYDLSKLLPVFLEHYKHSGVTITDPTRVIAGIIYFNDADSIYDIVNCFNECSRIYSNEMLMLRHYHNNNPDKMKTLPILNKNYTFGCSDMYINHSEDFNVIFDANCIGQYVGGIDIFAGNSGEGHINHPSEGYVVHPQLINLHWKTNENNLKVPYACDVPIVNLHIHSKNLKKWRSDA